MHQSLRTTPHNAFSSTTGTLPMRCRRRSRPAGLGGGGWRRRRRIFHWQAVAAVATTVVAFDPPDQGRRSFMHGCLHDDNNNDHCYCYYHCYNDNDEDVDDSMMVAQWQDVGINLDGGGTRSTMMCEPMMRGQAGGGYFICIDGLSEGYGPQGERSWTWWCTCLLSRVVYPF